MVHFKLMPVSNKTVSSQSGSFRESPWDTFLPYRSQTCFFPDPCIVHFKPIPVANKTVSSKRKSLRKSPWNVFCRLGPKLFSDLYRVFFKPMPLLNKTVSSQSGSLKESPWDVFSPNRSQSFFWGICCISDVDMLLRLFFAKKQRNIIFLYLGKFGTRPPPRA